jgi:hypothetical protein
MANWQLLQGPSARQPHQRQALYPVDGPSDSNRMRIQTKGILHSLSAVYARKFDENHAAPDIGPIHLQVTGNVCGQFLLEIKNASHV